MILKKLFNRLLPDFYINEKPYNNVRHAQQLSLSRVILAEAFPTLFRLDGKLLRAFDDSSALNDLSRGHKADIRAKNNKEDRQNSRRRSIRDTIKLSADLDDPIGHTYNDDGTITYKFEGLDPKSDLFDFVTQGYNGEDGIDTETLWAYHTALAKISNQDFKDRRINSVSGLMLRAPTPPPSFH